MISAVMAGMLCVFAALFTVFISFFAQHDLQNRAEKFGLQIARDLNVCDHSGQMNNVVLSSRELVYNSRTMQQDMAAINSPFEPLASQFLEESRDGAKQVEKERRHLIDLTIYQIKCGALASASERAGPDAILPWLHMGKSSVLSLNLGYVAGTSSNVLVTEGVNELRAFDQESKSFDAKTGLYFGNQVLKLPSPDNDLTFTISILAPPVKNTVSPARLLSASSFRSTFCLIKDSAYQPGSCQFMPSSVLLNESQELTSTLGPVIHDSLSAGTTAVSNGGCPPR
jgi:hypothetical protein